MPSVRSGYTPADGESRLSVVDAAGHAAVSSTLTYRAQTLPGGQMERAAVLPNHTVFTSCAIDIESSPDWVGVSLAGELDSVDASQVAQLLVDAVNAGTPVVRLDLSELTFADSSAISAILFAAQAAEARGVDYRLVNPRPRLQQILDITGLAEILTVVFEPDVHQGQSVP